MALTNCPECSGAMSESAPVCPHCGYHRPKPKKTKWWLWVPLGIIGAMYLNWAMTPEYEKEARRMREVCLRGFGTAAACETMYQNLLARGRAKADGTDKCPAAAPDCSWGR